MNQTLHKYWPLTTGHTSMAAPRFFPICIVSLSPTTGMDMNSIHTNRCRTAGDWGEKSVKSRPFQRSERSTGTAFSTSLPTASSTTPWLELVSVEVGWDHLLSLLYTCVQSLDFLALCTKRTSLSSPSTANGTSRATVSKTNHPTTHQYSSPPGASYFISYNSS